MREDQHKTQTLGFGESGLKTQEPLIFLSYAREDKDKVEQIYRKLQAERINAWLDVADLLPGQNWDRVVKKAIQNARFVLVFLSNHSIGKRGYIQKEISEALDLADRMPEDDIFIIPVRLENCLVPDRLAKWHWVDIFEPDGFKKITNVLKNNLTSENYSDKNVRVDAKLVVIGTSDGEALFHIDKVAIIGRTTSTHTADINIGRFDPLRVSRRHAIIFREGNSFMIKDCNSKNGIIINESIRLKQKETRILKNGDKIKLGDVEMRFVINTETIP